jgi:membrane-associated protease RseP (regulator of RpoE activity)
MFTKYSVSISCAVLASLASLAWAFQVPGAAPGDFQNGAKPAPEGQTQPAAPVHSAGVLASAMANFVVRTGLVVGPDADGRIVVEHLRPESDAVQAGVKRGDLVTSVNRRETDSFAALQNYLMAHPRQPAFDVGLRRKGQTFHKSLGRQISLIGMTIFPDLADRPYVYSVLPDSPAAKAGIRPGDVIVAVGDKTTDTMTKLMNFAILYVRSLAEGQGVGLRLVRNGKPIALSIPRPKDSEIQPLTLSEEHIVDRQGGTLSTQTQGPARPVVPLAPRPRGDLTSVVAVLYGPTQKATVGDVRGTVGYVMVQFTVPAPQTLNPPGIVTAVPQTSASIQPAGSIINPANPSTVPMIGGPRTGPRIAPSGFAAIVTAKLEGLPEGRYDLVVGQFGDCADLAAVAVQQVAVRLGSILVHANGEGSLNGAIGVAPRDFLARTVAVVAPVVPGTGNVPAAAATANTGNTITTGIWGCGVFHLANPRKPLPAEYPPNRVYPDRRPVGIPPAAEPAPPAPATPVPPPGPPARVPAAPSTTP